MFGKLAEAQQKAEEVKNRLAAITVEGIASNGLVKIVADGNRKIKDIQIGNELLTTDRKEELQDLLLIAIEHAMDQADNVSQSEMRNLMGAMGLGGMFGK